MQKAAERQGQSPYSEEQGEAKVSADVGNNSDLDLLDEDINYNETARATGFVGKASEVQWLRRVDAQKNPNQPEGPYGPPGEDVKSVSDRLSALRHRQKKDPWPVMHTSKASFYLDDEPFNTDLTADPLVMPPYETAEKLLHTYMESCHNSYPLLAKRPFMDQFYRCTFIQRAKLTEQRPIGDAVDVCCALFNSRTWRRLCIISSSTD